MLLSKLSRPFFRLSGAQHAGQRLAHTGTSWKDNFFVKHYPVTYLVIVVGGGITALFTYGILSLALNPDIYLPTSEIPRNEYYFNRLYFGSKPGTLDMKPPTLRKRRLPNTSVFSGEISPFIRFIYDKSEMRF
ncbi:hypothetical protein PHET_09801 [Paragonimus heterotremus]|uniref:Uncharacterized protein n=1 Tax=Paragonimus heterotremus TaxID=100268 RepID=A0A8J4SSZ4_9TREM|nr:hypothetical protein PHET_09801 [Paragonimus heterotremus]